jgi:hypothetical protein
MPRTTTNTKKATSKKTPPPKATYRPTKFGAIKFRSASAMVKYLLSKTKMPQVQIARRCKVTEACVSQLAREYR